MNQTEISKLGALLDQIAYLIDCPLHHYSHRTFKAPGIRREDNKLCVVFEFNENFVKINNVNFTEFNRLFQESWKVWSDICEEYSLVEHILKRHFEIESIKFYSCSSSRKDWFTFPLDINGMVEFERKLMFDDEQELNYFIDKLKKEAVMRRISSRNRF